MEHHHEESHRCCCGELIEVLRSLIRELSQLISKLTPISVMDEQRIKDITIDIKRTTARLQKAVNMNTPKGK